MNDDWDAQQREHFRLIRNGLLKTGFSRDVADAQAARAIRERDARPERARRSEEPTKDELYLAAKRYNITGRSKMDKEALEKAVAEYHRSHQEH